jgi:hypothetical protein
MFQREGRRVRLQFVGDFITKKLALLKQMAIRTSLSQDSTPHTRDTILNFLLCLTDLLRQLVDLSEIMTIRFDLELLVVFL